MSSGSRDILTVGIGALLVQTDAVVAQLAHHTDRPPLAGVGAADVADDLRARAASARAALLERGRAETRYGEAAWDRDALHADLLAWQADLRAALTALRTLEPALAPEAQVLLGFIAVRVQRSQAGRRWVLTVTPDLLLRVPPLTAHPAAAAVVAALSKAADVAARATAVDAGLAEATSRRTEASDRSDAARRDLQAGLRRARAWWRAASRVGPPLPALDLTYVAAQAHRPPRRPAAEEAPADAAPDADPLTPGGPLCTPGGSGATPCDDVIPPAHEPVVDAHEQLVDAHERLVHAHEHLVLAHELPGHAHEPPGDAHELPGDAHERLNGSDPGDDH